MIKELIQTIRLRKDLIWYLTVSDLKVNVARTYLGILWWIVDPVLYMLVFYLLVQIIFQRGGPDYSIFLFTALIPLKWTISCLVDATSAISSKGAIIKQVYVPKVIFVIVRLINNTIKFLISSFVLFLFLWVYGVNFTVQAFYYPIIVLIHAFLLFSCMLILSHIGVFIRDVKNLMQYVARMLLYLSPVLFSLDKVPKELVKYIYINPLTTLIISYRNVLIYGSDPQFLGLFILIIISLILVTLGLYFLSKNDKRYVKVI